jgi:hypothetical protein
MHKTVEITKRPYDGMFNVFHFTKDPNYDIMVVDENNTTYVPKRWLLTGVFENETEAKSLEKSILSANT